MLPYLPLIKSLRMTFVIKANFLHFIYDMLLNYIPGKEAKICFWNLWCPDQYMNSTQNRYKLDQGVPIYTPKP